MAKERSSHELDRVVQKIGTKADQIKAPILIEPPEMNMPAGKRRERAWKQHNAQKPYRTPNSFIPRPRKLGLEQYQNRPNRRDRPFGFEIFEDHVGFNRYDCFEQELSKMKITKKEEYPSNSRPTDSATAPLDHFRKRKQPSNITINYDNRIRRARDNCKKRGDRVKQLKY